MFGIAFTQGFAEFLLGWRRCNHRTSLNKEDIFGEG